MNLLWLGNPKTFDAALVGGKAANLSRLIRLYPRIPDGFCLPVSVMNQEHLLDRREEIEHAITGLIACHHLAEFHAAVRSSAVASFAGQHETYLNITGAEAILLAVARCWESARSDRALDYRRQQGLSVEGIRLAVLVQQLVAADVSIVVFSANPVTGSQEEVLINASWGLGESIVEGTVTPDAFVIRKSDLALLNRRISDKARMTVPVPDGTRVVNVPRFLREEPCLTEDQLVEITQLARSLEATMGFPVDIECAYASGVLYLLQCRPITTL